jgi:hypothetical protein
MLRHQPENKMSEKQATSANHLELWDSVQTTDPKYTKTFNRSGGFRGTSTNATYLAKRATEKFGPCGIGWGVKVIDEKMIEGHPFLDNEGRVIGNAMVHTVRVQLWYMLNGQRGEIEQFGQTEMVGRNKNGFYTDEEAPKKSITDAMTKCLSLLGFAADIHLGLYDDNKYVADLKHRDFDAEGQDGGEGRRSEDPRREEGGQPQRDHGARLTVQQHVTAMRGAKTEADLKRAFALAWKQYENPADPKAHTEAQNKLKEKYDEFMAKLGKSDKAEAPADGTQEFMPE